MRDGNQGAFVDDLPANGVLSLPMRDGNNPWRTAMDVWLEVLSLPMRDGNPSMQRQAADVMGS